MQTEPKRQPQRPSDNAFRRPLVTREIVIPIGLEDYHEVVEANDRFRNLLTRVHELHPECYKPEFDADFSFKDFKYSKKMDIRIRRIRVGLGTGAHFWRVVPCDVMPYMVGRTDEVEKEGTAF